MLRFALIVKLCIPNNPDNNNSRMADPFDYRAAYLKLRTQNELLRAELEDASERESSLKRQIEIMSQLQTNNSSIIHPVDTVWIKEQLSNVLSQKQHLEATNRTLLQKIEDLKYHNGELRSLNDKMTNLHSREMEMLRREVSGGQRLRELEDRERVLTKQREILSKKLQEVAKVAEEMEHYYVTEVQRRNEQLKNRDQQLKNQQEEIVRLNRDLEGTRTHRLQQNDLVRQTNLKWQQHLLTIQDQHQAQICQLRGKVKFLIDKIEDQGVCKPSLTTMNAELVQSKMIQSNSSLDSFRIGPSSSLGPVRRNTSGAKTPSKYGKTRMSGALMERNA